MYCTFIWLFLTYVLCVHFSESYANITGRKSLTIFWWIIVKRKLRQWWSPISPISTKRTITSHLYWTHWTQSITTTYDVDKSGPGLRQAQTRGGDWLSKQRLSSRILKRTLLIIGRRFVCLFLSILLQYNNPHGIYNTWICHWIWSIKFISTIWWI